MSSPRASVFLLVAVLAAPLAAAAQNELPDGDAKEAVQAMCVQCHQIGRVTGMHLSRDEWKITVEDMIRMGAQIPPDWVDVLADYLGEHFPAKVDVSMTVDPMPATARTAGAPPSVSVDVHGTLLRFELRGGTLVGVDPAGGKTLEWPVPGGAQSQTRSIAILNDAVWFVENGTRVLVRFDPKAETFQTWPIPAGPTEVTHIVSTTEGTLIMTGPGGGPLIVAHVK